MSPTTWKLIRFAAMIGARKSAPTTSSSASGAPRRPHRHRLDVVLVLRVVGRVVVLVAGVVDLERRLVRARRRVAEQLPGRATQVAGPRDGRTRSVWAIHPFRCRTTSPGCQPAVSRRSSLASAAMTNWGVLLPTFDPLRRGEPFPVAEAARARRAVGLRLGLGRRPPQVPGAGARRPHLPGGRRDRDHTRAARFQRDAAGRAAARLGRQADRHPAAAVGQPAAARRRRRRRVPAGVRGRRGAARAARGTPRPRTRRCCRSS